jgi:hypothetical protein
MLAYERRGSGDPLVQGDLWPRLGDFSGKTRGTTAPTPTRERPWSRAAVTQRTFPADPVPSPALGRRRRQFESSRQE